MEVRGWRLSVVIVTGRQKMESSEVKVVKALWSSGETISRLVLIQVYLLIIWWCWIADGEIGDIRQVGRGKRIDEL